MVALQDAEACIMHITCTCIVHVVVIRPENLMSFSFLTTALDNLAIKRTFRLDALVLLKANEAKAWGPQFIATSRLAGARRWS